MACCIPFVFTPDEVILCHPKVPVMRHNGVVSPKIVVYFLVCVVTTQFLNSTPGITSLNDALQCARLRLFVFRIDRLENIGRPQA